MAETESILTIGDGQLAIANVVPQAGGRGTVQLKPVNHYDRSQYWKLSPDAQGGVYIASAVSPKDVLDVADEKGQAGQRVGLWSTKQNQNAEEFHTRNQRWDLPTAENQPIITKLSDQLALGVSAQNTLVLVNKQDVTPAQSIHPVAAPISEQITLVNKSGEDVTITWDNTTLSPKPSWPLAAGQQKALPFFAGHVLVARNAGGRVLRPTPVTVNPITKTIEILPFTPAIQKSVLHINDAEFPSLALTWDTPAAEGLTLVEYHLKQLAPKTTDERLSPSTTRYVLNGATVGTEYKFQIVAVYNDGEQVLSDVASLTHAAQPPGKPTLSYEVADDESVVLVWTAAQSTAPLTKYTVLQNAPAGQAAVEVEGSVLRYRISPIVKHTLYTFQVRASSGGGNGPLSNPVSFKFIPPPPTKPTIKWTRNGNDVTIEWKSTANGSSPIAKYFLSQYGGPDAGVPEFFGADKLSFTFQPKYGVLYKFFVNAQNADLIDSPKSENISFQLDKTKPSAPKLKVQFLAPDHVRFTWSVPDNGGVEITSYTLSSSAPTPRVNYQGSDTQAEVNVPRILKYSFAVTATNSEGTSENSNVIEFIPPSPDDLPAAPQALTYSKSEKPAATADAATYTVQWAGPAQPAPTVQAAPNVQAAPTVQATPNVQAPPVAAQYRIVQEKPVAKETDVPGTQTSFDLEVKANAPTTSLYVVGLSAAGQPGLPSRVLKLAVGLPAPTLTAVASGTDIILTWTAVAGATEYHLQQQKPQAQATYDGSATTFTVKNAVMGTTYKFVVSADGPTGESVASNPATATPSGYAPAEPVLTYTLLANNTVHLTWTTPADRGSPITSYTLTKVAPAPSTAIYNGTSLAFDYPVEPGVQYQFQVTATNAIGTSTPSTPVTVLVPKRPPPPFTAYLIQSAGNSVTIGWNIPPGTPPGTVYDVKSVAPLSYTLNPSGVAGPPYHYPDLVVGTYVFVVTARSPDGSTDSNTVMATVTGAFTPGGGGGGCNPNGPPNTPQLHISIRSNAFDLWVDELQQGPVAYDIEFTNSRIGTMFYPPQPVGLRAWNNIHHPTPGGASLTWRVRARNPNTGATSNFSNRVQSQ